MALVKWTKSRLGQVTYLGVSDVRPCSVGRSSADYTRRRASDAYETPQGVQALEQSMLALERQAQGIIKIKFHRPSVSLGRKPKSPIRTEAEHYPKDGWL